MHVRIQDSTVSFKFSFETTSSYVFPLICLPKLFCFLCTNILYILPQYLRSFYSFSFSPHSTSQILFHFTHFLSLYIQPNKSWFILLIFFLSPFNLTFSNITLLKNQLQPSGILFHLPVQGIPFLHVYKPSLLNKHLYLIVYSFKTHVILFSYIGV